MRKNIILQDARDVYPFTPSDKVMGTIFLNLGFRLLCGLLVIWLFSHIALAEDSWLISRVISGIVLVVAVAHIGYFMYTFNEYLQENMRRTIERRNAELKQKQKLKSGTKSSTKKHTSEVKRTTKRAKK